ncbi:hypothetical protein [Enterococcus cecorum]|uniref:hypothetical protein n=1 Tax=Enterococcus cecorum TaxID=44008 RepID=UPI002ACA4815|nr:hypothetical protein [Enterococcus cecorum]MDZ5560716.1 hypothetical protein [Enterococcus cecorum]
MKKKYSIHAIKEQKKKEKSQIDKTYRRTKGITLYLGALFTFMTIGLMIALTPFIFGKSYDYVTVKLNDPQNVSSSLNLIVDDMKMNKETGLFKLVLRYKEDTGTKSLSNIKSDIKLNYITNKGKNETKTKVIKLSDEYTVVYYEGLPKDFGVISVSVNPRYIYPELEPSNDLKDKEIKFYAVDNDIKSDSKLAIKSTSELKKENFKYQIKAINRDIDSLKTEINKLNLSNEINRKDIKKAKDKLDFQTFDEQTETKNEISSLNNSIESNNERIKELKETIKLYEEKIKQLEKTASSFA